MNIIKTTISNDQTKKYFFKVVDTPNIHVEACLLHLDRYGHIICISSQIGCSQKCKFCAASKGKFVRNLTCDELKEQVQLIVQDNPKLLEIGFQITYMGSGEPLSNYVNVFDSIDYFRQQYSNLNKVNISTTCPITSKECFDNVDWQKYRDFLHFQYSLHFTKNEERFKFLWPQLLKITDAIKYLNRISHIINDTYKINYIPFDNVNDSADDIEELQQILSTTNNAKLKISRMCEVSTSKFLPSKSFEDFVAKVKDLIEDAEVFSSDGTDVNAGCGQFYNESIV